MVSLRVPLLAKRVALSALARRESLPSSRRFGIDKQQASSLGIVSGVERAKQIARVSHLPHADVVRVARFYQRFKNCDTPKCEGAHELWGGRRFERRALAHVKKEAK
jgi:hypothetical protein